MKRPDLTPECSRGHAVGSSPDRRLVAVGLVLIGTPLLAGSLASVSIADEAVGPLVTLLAWIAIFIYRAVRARGSSYVVEWIAVAGSLVMMQLLLDLHTPHLGDIIIVALHAGYIAIVLVRNYKTRSTVRPSASSDDDVEG